MQRIPWSKIPRTPLRATAVKAPQRGPARFHQALRHSSSVPRIGQASFWKSLIPKPLRRDAAQPGIRGTPSKPKEKKKGWNPATIFIVLFLFIGSNSIQMIILRKDFDEFSRRARLRIGLLREVVERLQKGEEVDVEKALGTGDAEKEQEWEEALKAIERGDILKKNNESAEKPKPSPSPSQEAQGPSTQTDAESRERRQDAKIGSFSSFY
ncbi:hypothetical protein GGR56DRAFT_311178 [Xylariaceae sp. FL0804]|nr:hypothetical protein GGR56DRAFT_311178 [Xylariaceae sp. FL0804]